MVHKKDVRSLIHAIKAVQKLKKEDVLTQLSNGISYPLANWEDGFEKLQRQYEELDNSAAHNIRVAVVGAYSSGKSSFINSILGQEFAPSAVDPTTQGITHFVYGDKQTITSGEKKISYKEYVCQIQQEGSKEFWVTFPCEFLRNKELIDTVGLFEPKKAQANWEMSAKDKELIRHADVLLYVVDGNYSTIKLEEQNFLNEILDPHAEKTPLLYIILNRMDKVTKSDLKQLLLYIEKFCTEQNFKLERCMPYCSLLTQNRPDCVEARKKVLEALEGVEERYRFISQHVAATKRARLDKNLTKLCADIKKQLPSAVQIKRTFAALEDEKDDIKKAYTKQMLELVEDVADSCLAEEELVICQKDDGDWLDNLIDNLCSFGNPENYSVTLSDTFENWETHFDNWNFNSKDYQREVRNICNYVFNNNRLKDKLCEDFDLDRDIASSKTASEANNLINSIPPKAKYYILKWAKSKISPVAEKYAVEDINKKNIMLEKAHETLLEFQELLCVKQ